MFTLLYVYTCIADQNAYSKVSDTFIDKKETEIKRFSSSKQ